MLSSLLSISSRLRYHNGMVKITIRPQKHESTRKVAVVVVVVVVVAMVMVVVLIVVVLGIVLE